MEILNLSAKENSKGSSQLWAGNVAISGGATGLDLKKELSKLSGIPVNEIQKLLCSGKFLKDDATLLEQGVKNSSKLLFIRNTTESIQKIDETINKSNKVDIITKAAQKMAERNEEESDGYTRTMELVNQNGERVALKPEDEKALKLGMTLHEQGKAQLHKGDYQHALQYLVEADKGFSQCSPEFLNVIDNYGLLCLDLAWSYFKLKDPSFLQDAAWRLTKAEECLKKSHGENFERLIQLRGNAGPDLALWCRLYLLLGVLKYHSQQIPQSKNFLQKAQEIIEKLNVDENSMISLKDMGFTERESRLSLRAHPRDMASATSWILRKREEKQTRAEEERKRKREQREKVRLGKTSTGRWVDIQLLNQIVSIGFQRKLAAEALKQTDNNVDQAIGLLTTSPHLLEVKDTPNEDKIREKIANIVQMGFSHESALGTLRKANFDTNRAIEMLLNGLGEEAAVEDVQSLLSMNHPNNHSVSSNEISGTSNEPLGAEQTNNIDGMMDEDNDEENEDVSEEHQQKMWEEHQEREAEEELVENMEEDEDAYLDVTLDEEKSVLQEYLALIAPC